MQGTIINKQTKSDKKEEGGGGGCGGLNAGAIFKAGHTRLNSPGASLGSTVV